MFKVCIIKNTSNSNLEFSTILEPNQEYQIPDTSRIKWVEDDRVYNAICDGSLAVSNGSDYVDTIADAVRVLHSDVQEDTEGSALARTKVCTTGWAYCSKCLELTTASLGTLVAKMMDGTEPPFITEKFTNLDESIEYTTQEDIELYATKTIVDFEPPMDIEIKSGALVLEEEISKDVFVYALMVPDIPKAYGGSVEFICSKNLRFLKAKTPLVVDGGAAKPLTYCPTYHTNKIRIIFIHDVGVKIKAQIEICFYRAVK